MGTHTQGNIVRRHRGLAGAWAAATLCFVLLGFLPSTTAMVATMLGGGVICAFGAVLAGIDLWRFRVELDGSVLRVSHPFPALGKTEIPANAVSQIHRQKKIPLDLVFPEMESLFIQLESGQVIQVSHVHAGDALDRLIGNVEAGAGRGAS